MNVTRDKAELNDTTIADALTPATVAQKQPDSEGDTVAQALSKAADARSSMQANSLLARPLRASNLGEHSIGHHTPSITPSFWLAKTSANTWTDEA